MKYVLDSNIAVKWMLPEPDSAEAMALRDDLRNKIHELLAPDVFPVEVGHAFTRAERQRRITPPESLNFWADVMTTLPVLVRTLPLMPRALVLSSQARIGVYDCLYVALAEQEQCMVVTGDQELVKTFPSIVVPLSSL